MSIVLDVRTATDHFPGIGRYVVNLAHALAETRLAGQLTLLHDPSAGTRLPLPALTQVACPISPFALRQQWGVPSQLRRCGARLYHSPYYLMPFWPGVPTVLTCHDVSPLVYPNYYTPLQRLIYRLTNTLALNAARAIIVISQCTRRDLLHYFHPPAEKIFVVLEAADPHFQPQPPSAVAALREKYALPERYVLYFGSNKPHKNLVRLVQAFGQAALPHPATGLVIAGHWDPRYPEAKALATQAGWQDRIKFIGAVPEADLPALYTGATLFAFPSEYEGFGLPPLEAMACGTPVVCSNASSLPEVVGEAGVLLPPDQPQRWADTFTRLIDDPAQLAALRERSRARARQFTWQQAAEQTLAIYERVLHT
jgi:glycosyltransferase involved in cell wall biosynthesis